MATEPKKLRGILKKPNVSLARRLDAAPASGRSQEDAQDIAIHHATILQQRKDLEFQIFEAINQLLEFPLVRSPEHSASEPAPSDATQFTGLVRLFQPGDYDDLVEERNIAGLCGYGLCARPRRVFEGAGAYKLMNVGRRDFNIARTADLEKWCSEACARRALYIKVQLSETAAWERVGIPDLKIDLLEEKPDSNSAGDGELARDVARLKLEEERTRAKKAASLALERGDVGENLPAPGRSFDIPIREKNVTSPVTEPLSESGKLSEGHLMVEGHKTKHGNERDKLSGNGE